MVRWTLDDIPWTAFEPSKVDPDILRIVKAAALVERNGGDYARYLQNVFHDDPEFQALAGRWGSEEAQHGEALARWASLADPDFDFAAACERFAKGFRFDLDAQNSVRGSRSGELVARCIVETGTSSYYTALAEATEEPVLRAVCQRIAADELRHYKLFYKTMRNYLEREGLGRWARLRIAAGRIRETEDDELAYAYYAANEPEGVYDRGRFTRAYGSRAFSLYRPHHLERGTAMIFKTVGLNPNGLLNRFVNRLAWWFMRNRVARLQRLAA